MAITISKWKEDFKAAFYVAFIKDSEEALSNLIDGTGPDAAEVNKRNQDIRDAVAESHKKMDALADSLVDAVMLQLSNAKVKVKIDGGQLSTKVLSAATVAVPQDGGKVALTTLGNSIKSGDWGTGEKEGQPGDEAIS